MKRGAVRTSFHDYQHALEFDQRAGKSDIRASLGLRLIEAMELKGQEWVLDIATGTGRFAKPVSQHLKGGKVVGVDEAPAMLSVGREKTKQEPIPGYLQIGGDAQVLPFRSEIFDRAFVAFSLHHFSSPSLMVQETFRVLRSGGKFAILDPVVLEPEDSVDQALIDLVNQVFRRSHGENFRFCSGREIRELLARAGFQISRADLHSFSFDQDGMEGVPTGRHWLEVAEELQTGSDKLRERLERSYFRYQKKGSKRHVKGKFSYALVCGERR
ncbi:MAG: class I SAM-dependent methyltransferase [Candidatus Binatia bacterium]